ncbi:hypothetical protein [Serratia liquefaciens]|uniref:hypothetical protein n=1 Tax=Serratia liquefaciens TaxID=614 RepID=UPI0039065F61
MKASISTYAKYPLILMAVAMIAACSGVSFTHADDVAGGCITNAEVQPGSTVILTYSDGSACIDNSSGLRRDDTTDGRKAEDAGAQPEAAAQTREEGGLNGERVNIERVSNGKNAVR